MNHTIKTTALALAAVVFAAPALAVPIVVSPNITFDLSVLQFLPAGEQLGGGFIGPQVNDQGDVAAPFGFGGETKILFIPNGGGVTTIRDYADPIALANGASSQATNIFDFALAGPKIFTGGDSSAANGPVFFVEELSTTGAPAKLLLQEDELFGNTGERLVLPRQLSASPGGEAVAIANRGFDFPPRDTVLVFNPLANTFIKMIDDPGFQAGLNGLAVGSDGTVAAVLNEFGTGNRKVVVADGTSVTEIARAGDTLPGGIDPLIFFGTIARDGASGDNFFSFTLESGDLGIAKSAFVGGITEIFNPAILGENINAIGDQGVSNAGLVFEYQKTTLANTLALIDENDNVNTILESGDLLNIDGVDRTILELDLSDGGVAGDFITVTVTVDDPDATGGPSKFVTLLELQSSAPGPTPFPTADLSRSDLEYDAADLVATLNSFASRDNDDVNGNEEPENGISSINWSVFKQTGINDPPGQAFLNSPDRIVEIPIEESGLTRTTDVTTVQLTVVENDIEENINIVTDILTYRNVSPTVRAVTASNDGDRVSFQVTVEDPDIAVNDKIPGFETVRTELNLTGTQRREGTRSGTEAIFLGLETSVSKANLFVGGASIAPANIQVRDLFGLGEDGVFAFELDRDTFTNTGGLAVFMNTGSPVSVSQDILIVPDAPFTFQFDYLFADLDGVLEVFLNDTLLISLNGADFANDFFSTAFVAIAGDLLGLTDAVLTFTFDGSAGLELLLDNIIFPDLANGDFNDGTLDGWLVTTNGASFAEVRQFALDPPPPSADVPEPASLALFGAGLFGLAFARRRLRAGRLNGQRATTE